MEVVCSQCQMRYEVEEEEARQGKISHCPSCKEPMSLPAVPTDESPPDLVKESEEPKGPAASWDSGSLLLGGASAEEDESEWGSLGASGSGQQPGTTDPGAASASFPPPAQSQSVPPTPGGSGADGWAAEAARWAASGFSTGSMPGFVQEKEKPAAGTSQVPGDSAESKQADNSEQGLVELNPEALTRTPTPPPLPKATADYSEPVTPPPLDSKKICTYVMRGSGEEGAASASSPWAQVPDGEFGEVEKKPQLDHEPAAGKKADSILMKIPTALGTETAAGTDPSVKPVPVPVERPPKTWLWVLALIVLVGIGGLAAWYFIKESRQLDYRGGSDHTAATASDPDRGTAAAKDKEKPGPDAGASTETAVVESTPAAKAPIAKPPAESRKRKKALKHYRLGNELIRKRKYKGAIRAFRRTLKVDPSLAAAHRGLGIAFAQLRKNRLACREYALYKKTLSEDSKEIPELEKILKSCRR